MTTQKINPEEIDSLIDQPEDLSNLYDPTIDNQEYDTYVKSCEETLSNRTPTPPINSPKSYLDYLSISTRVLKDKLWYGLWHFDLFEKVDRCYANESYYASLTGLLSQEPTHIIDNLYLGSAFNAADYTWLTNNHIDIVINVAPGISNFYNDQFEYYNINVEDLAQASMLPHFEAFYNLVENNQDKKIFVHCFAGKSRSASLVLYYIIKKYGWSLEKSINYMKNLRPSININCTFIEEIQRIISGSNCTQDQPIQKDVN
tara:strand:+ start:541 stop:1317 length:777 start_codon:yes stop_codon:yes gene_type:complete